MNESYWISSAEGNRYESINADVETDYLVIGGGIAGITSFFLLARSGRQAVLIDADRVGYGCTSRSTGKISCQHGLLYSTMEKKFGIDNAKLYYEINRKAIDFIEKNVQEYNIDCEFERLSAVLFTQDENYVERLENEYETYQRMGIDSELLDSIPLPVPILKALVMKNQAQFHPKLYVDALAKLATEQHGTIYEDTRVVDFESGDICTVKTSKGHTIKARHVIITTHFPCYDGAGLYFAKLKPTRTYAVAAKYEQDFPHAHFINAEDPTRSLRYVPKDKLLVIVGESHKVGHHNKDYYQSLKDFGKEHFKIEAFNYQWSAQDYYPPHDIPFIGYLNKNHKNIFVATGFLKWGLSNGTAAALIIQEMIESGHSEYENLFTHGTLTDILSSNFLLENADVVVQLIGGKLKIGDRELPDEPGIGRIVRMEGKRCGYYMDENHDAYIVDITCRHLGCELKWNDMEKSWDCPCHGSRFDYKGNVLEGPAELKLNAYHEDKNTINPQIS